MDIDALRQAHEKLKRKSQRQRDRIKELESWMDRELNSGKTSDLYYGIHRKEGQELLTQG